MAAYDVASEQRPVVRLSGGLELRACTDPSDPLLDTFFEGYDRAFVLPNEKEEIGGFRDCLSLNLPPRYEQLAHRYGPFREFVAVAVDAEQAPATPVGGANFICYPLTGENGQPILVMNLNYIFVLPEHRGQGYFRPILEACKRLARNAFVPRGDVSNPEEATLLMFMELNDPLRLDSAEYTLDTDHSGMDQLTRIGIWVKVGAKIVDFPYVQPALSKNQAADRNLILAVLGTSGTELPARLLHKHLERFFAISVLKGADPLQNPDASDQLKRLGKMCAKGTSVGLVDPTPFFERPEPQRDIATLRRLDGNLAGAMRNVLFWEEQGTLHVTLSLLVERDRLRDGAPEESTKAVGAKVKDVIKAGWIAKSIEPMFDDIADRKRQIFCDEVLIDTGGDGKPNSREVISLFVPTEIFWCTEGTKWRYRSRDCDRVWEWKNIVCRYFWFRHSNGDLSYHIALELPYQHCLKDYYALSLLQKVFFPSEGSKQGSQLWTDPNQTKSLTDFLIDKFNVHFDALRIRHVAVAQISAKGRNENWWSRLVENAEVEQEEKDAESKNTDNPALSTWNPKHCRAAFLLQDPCFDHVLRQRQDYFGPLKKALQKRGQSVNELQECGAQQDKNPQDVMPDGLGRPELALIFLSGYLQNIIDFFEQDEAEFVDGTDPLYPKVMKKNPNFLLYATQDVMFEVVSQSRSLESGCKCIGTCPYLFLVHVTLFHDEALLRRFEYKVKKLVADVEGSGVGKKPNLPQLRDLAKNFHERRLEIFSEIEKYMHLNVFLYDTEQDFYGTVSKARGVQVRQRHWEELINKLNKTVEGSHALAQHFAAEKRQEVAEDQELEERKLNKMAFWIAVIGLFQVLFALTTAWRAILASDAPQPTNVWDVLFVIPINFVDFLFTVVFVIVFFVAARKWWKIFSQKSKLSRRDGHA